MKELVKVTNDITILKNGHEKNAGRRIVRHAVTSTSVTPARKKHRRRHRRTGKKAVIPKINVTLQLNNSIIDPPKILYITSFTGDMYDLTGKPLVKSFDRTNQYGELLLCPESFKLKSTHLVYPLHKDPWLKQWLEAHKDLIPDYLGGMATQSSNPDLFNNTWNRLASRWFRKVASLNYALQSYGNDYDYFIWIDSDCEFQQTIPVAFFQSLLSSRAMFYYFGEYRNKIDTGYETGFIGFNLKYHGKEILQEWINVYHDRKFLDHPRWDDGYTLRMVNESHSFPTIDLSLSNENSPLVYPNVFHNYVMHKKGVHQRNNIMK